MNAAIVFRRFRYGFRSFDRQWIIPDNRVLNRPNPELWRSHGEQAGVSHGTKRSFADGWSSAFVHGSDS